MMTYIRMKSLAFVHVAAVLAACNGGVKTTGQNNARSDNTTSDAKVAADPSVQVQTNSGNSTAASSSNAEPRIVTPTDLLGQVGTTAATRTVSGPADAGPVAATDASAPEHKGSYTPAEIEALICSDMTQRIIVAHAANPLAMNQQDAQELTDLLCTYTKNAAAKDATAAAQTWNTLNKKIMAIAAKRQASLALYDNSNFLGRILNGVNGLLDVGVQLYAGIISLDPKIALGAGESAARNVMHLFN